MRRVLPRPAYAIAASIVVIAIAAPLALHVNGIGPFAPPRDAQGGKQREAKVNKAPAKPAKLNLLSSGPTVTQSRDNPSLMKLWHRTTNKPSADKSPPTASHVTETRRRVAELARLRAERTQRIANKLMPKLGSAGRPADGRAGKLDRLTPSLTSQVSAIAPTSSSGVARTQALLGQRQPVAGFVIGSDGTILLRPPNEGRDRFESIVPNTPKSVRADPVATFSSDVDTASYGFVRRTLNAGELPPKNAVRIEELLNYFSYSYAPAESRETPFRPLVHISPSPWNPHTQLMHIAIKGHALKAAERPRANLVFLIDVSGSMQGEDRLPLLKNSFRMLLDNLDADDTVGLVTYASGSSIALKPTKVSDKATILAAIEGLGAGGSTAGARGIRDAYALAETNFDKAAVNRVILGTDGDFNVGISNREELKSYIESKRKSGIFLSILGVGRGNYNDALMQTLAQNGNGTAAYIDTINEARKVLVEEAASTLFPIAKDVKFQIEFNPARVSHYRLIGYETRALRREDFNNDKVDAGDIGSGHAVTAIFEITPVGAPQKLVDGLRYQPRKASATPVKPDGDAEFAFLKIRYKLPDSDKSKLITLAVTPAMQAQSIAALNTDLRFSIAVAAFGQLLNGGIYMQDFSYDDIIALANNAKGPDPYGLRAEFVNLVRLAKSAR